MTFYILVDLTVTYLQYIFGLIAISPTSFPDFYIEPFRSLAFISLEFLERIRESDRYKNPLEVLLPFWIPLDYRLKFAVIAVLVPFLVAVLGILIVCSSGGFAWTLMLLTALFTMLLGIVLFSDSSIKAVWDISHNSSLVMVVVGSLLSFLLVLYGVLSAYLLRRRARKEEDAIMKNTFTEATLRKQSGSLTEEAVSRRKANWRGLAALHAYNERKKRYMRRCHVKTSLPQAFLAVASAVAGMIFVGWVPISTISFFQKSVPGQVAGGILLVAACATFAWVALGTFMRGRHFQLSMRSTFSTVSLDFIMLATSLIYNPVFLHVISIFWCTEANCGAGKRLVPSGSVMWTGGNNSLWGPVESPCQACNFSMYEQNCPDHLQKRFCGESFRQSRLAYDQSVQCDEINIFYKMSAVVIILAYTVSYPVFLLVVADCGTEMLEKDFPLPKRLCDEFTEDELYYEKLMRSSNVAASIYNGYKRRHRKARIVFFFQRVILVLISAFTRRGLQYDVSWLGMGLVLIVVIAYFVYIAVARPFVRPLENLYGASHQIVIAAVAAMGLAGNRLGRDSVPFGIAVFIAVLIFLAPFATFIVGLVWSLRNERERARRLQRRLESGFAFVRNDPATSSVVGAGANDSREIGDKTAAAFDQGPEAAGNRTPAQEHHPLASSTLLERATEKGLPSAREAPSVRNSTLASIPAPRRQPSQIFGKGAFAESEGIGNDYFSDKRLFIPRAYFKAFEDVPVVKINELEENERCKAVPRDQMEKSAAEKLLQNIFLLFTLRRTLRSQVRESSAEEQGAASGNPGQEKNVRGENRHVAQEKKNSKRRSLVGENEEEALETWDTRRSKLHDRWQQWINVFNIGATPLQYSDVLERQKELKMSSGVRERPFWLNPSETQRQAYNVQGSLVPRFHPSVNHCDSLPMFPRIGLHARLSPKWTQTLRDYSPLGAPLGANLRTTRGKGPLDHDDADPHAFSSTDYSAQQVPWQATLTSMPALTLPISVEAAALESKDPEAKSNELALRQALIQDAQQKLEWLDHCCSRKLEPFFERAQRSTVFVPLVPKVCLGGAKDANWDRFLDGVLTEANIQNDSSSEPMSSCGVRESEIGKMRRHVDIIKVKDSDKHVLQVPDFSEKAHASQPHHHHQSSTEKRVPMLKQHFLLRRHLCLAYKNQGDQLRSLQKAVDFSIASTIKKYMQVFFILLSVFTTAAIVLCLRGMLENPTEHFVDGVPRSNSVDHQLMGHDSWESFTKHCCCVSMVNLTASYPYYVLDIEDWMCSDGRVKQRVRRDAYENQVISGYNVRGLCGMTFNNGCRPNITANTVELIGCDDTVTEAEKKRW